jgi:hypothetical protein
MTVIFKNKIFLLIINQLIFVVNGSKIPGSFALLLGNF